MAIFAEIAELKLRLAKTYTYNYKCEMVGMTVQQEREMLVSRIKRAELLVPEYK